MSPNQDDGKYNNVFAWFWTEHSSRPSLPSWARALGVLKEITDRLGYWSVGAESVDLAIRTYRQLIATPHGTIAKFMRLALQASGTCNAFPDLFGEVGVADELDEKLQKHDIGYRSEDLHPRKQLPWASANHDKHQRFQQKYGWDGLKEKDSEAIGQVQAPEADESSSSSGASKLAPMPHRPNSAAWVVTKPNAKGLGCLRVVGRCYRVPGIHYQDWTDVAESVPAHAYEKACEQCFPLGFLVVTDGHIEVVSSKREEGMPAVLLEEELSSSHS